ncbi:hypothetical protein DL96DRAFT_1622606, partial [Flagelloscypha sp. PMI_526]
LRHWIHYISSPKAPNDEITDVLARVLCLLPAIRKMHLTAGLDFTYGTIVSGTWNAYPAFFLQTLNDHTFTSLTYLQLQDLHSVPYKAILLNSPKLRVLDLTLDGFVGQVDPPFEPAIHGVSALRHLLLRGAHTHEFLVSPMERTLFDTFTSIRVRLSHLSLNAERWNLNPAALAGARDAIMTQRYTLTVFTLRWFQIDARIPIALFQDCQFPSLVDLILGLEWKYTENDDSIDMGDIAQMIYSAPALQVLRLNFKPAMFSQAATFHGWKELDQALVANSVLLRISVEVAGQGTRVPPSFKWTNSSPFLTGEQISRLLPSTLESGMLELCEYDGIFDWCFTRERSVPPLFT